MWKYKNLYKAFVTAQYLALPKDIETKKKYIKRWIRDKMEQKWLQQLKRFI